MGGKELTQIQGGFYDIFNPINGRTIKRPDKYLGPKYPNLPTPTELLKRKRDAKICARRPQEP